MSKVLIMETAMKEAVEYVKSLNLKFHFSRLLEQYIGYHNRGVYLKFNFGASKTKDYFGHYMYRHDLGKDILESLSDRKVRDTRMAIIYAKDRQSKRKISAENEYANWKSQLRDLERRIENIDPGEVVDPKFSIACKSLRAIVQTKMNTMREKVENEVIAEALLVKMEKRYKRISDTFEEMELQVMIQVVEYFMRSLSRMISQLFIGDNVQIVYSRKEIKKRYQEKKRNNYRGIEPYPDRSLSNFEREILGFLQSVAGMYKVVIQKDEFSYKLVASEYGRHYTVAIEQKNEELEWTRDEQDAIFEPYVRFLDKYSGFAVMLNTLQAVHNKFGEEEAVIQEIANLINESYSPKVLMKYKKINDELTRKLPKQPSTEPKWYSGQIGIDKFIEAFPHIHFEAGAMEDQSFNMVMKQYGGGDQDKRHIHFISDIEREDWVLTLKQQEESE